MARALPPSDRILSSTSQRFTLRSCRQELAKNLRGGKSRVNNGVLERHRREMLGVPTRMSIYEDELQDAPAQIEALAGCLARDLAERIQAMWPSSRIRPDRDR